MVYEIDSLTAASGVEAGGVVLVVVGRRSSSGCGGQEE